MYHARVCARVFVGFPPETVFTLLFVDFFVLNNAATAFATYSKGAFMPDKLEQVKKEKQQQQLVTRSL